MNLDIVLEWMKTFDGKVTPGAIQRKFGVGIWYADRIYDLIVKNGHVKDEKRMNHIMRETKREAAEEMYDVIDRLVPWLEHDPNADSDEYHAFAKEMRRILKKARGES
jgi:hypothetical protein